MAAEGKEEARIEGEVAPSPTLTPMLATEAPSEEPEMAVEEKARAEGEDTPGPPLAPPAMEAPLEEPETAVEEKAAARTEGEAAPSPTPAWAVAAEAPADGLEVAVEEAEEPAAEERASEAMLEAETPSPPMGGGGPTEEPATLAVPTAQPTAAPVVVSGAAQTSTNAAEAPLFSDAPAEGDLGLAELTPVAIDATSVPIHAAPGSPPAIR